MSLDLGDIIDQVVDAGTVTLEAIMPQDKESVRVMLTMKFRKHCYLLNSVGYLPEELEDKTLRFRYDKHKQELTVALGAKRKSHDWKVLGVDE